jgi:predicted protein tyrosine phosphatase
MNIVKRFLDCIRQNKDTGIFREIPLKVKGGLYVSPMPYGAYDPGSCVFKLYLKHKIDHVFILVTDEELAKKSRRNLIKKYKDHEITFSRFTLKDWMAPSMEVVEEMVQEARIRLKTQRIAVHCHAGVGRTAIAVCCIAMIVEGWSAVQAMKNISEYMTINITTEQKNFINKFEATAKAAK